MQLFLIAQSKQFSAEQRSCSHIIFSSNFACTNTRTEWQQKLWEKSVTVDRDVERYTVGRDREMDMYLAPYDVLGSMAHITMLESIGLLEKANWQSCSTN